jgi:hypothetical protein
MIRIFHSATLEGDSTQLGVRIGEIVCAAVAEACGEPVDTFASLDAPEM